MTLHKKISSMSSLTGRTLQDISAVCGEPKTIQEREFMDVGPGRSVTWKKGLFTFCLNFDADNNFCGVSYIHDLTPYMVVLAISVFIVGGAALVIALL